MRFEQVKNDLKAAMSAQAPKTSGYDTRAEVVRVEGDKAWVHIPGGVDETPVSLTIDAKEGDQVQVRVAGGTAWLTGNATAPPTDDRTAIAAGETAENARVIAVGASESAETARVAAESAVESAETAASAANAAQTSASEAKTSATNAAEYASRALGNLSTVQSVAETLAWITQHGTMTLTTDTTPDPAHVYFVRDANGDYEVGNYKYSIVAEPVAADMGSYYELSIDESLNNYVGTHLAVTGEGLWVLPAASNSYKVLVATGRGTQYTEPGLHVIDETGLTIGSYGENGFKLFRKSSGDLEIFLGHGPAVDETGQLSDMYYYTIGSRFPSSSIPIGGFSHAFGTGVTSENYASFAEGFGASAKGFSSHAEGRETTASGEESHAEGYKTTAGVKAHSEGYYSDASGNTSHAEGDHTVASGDYSHAQNWYTTAASVAQTAMGRYNTADPNGNYALIVGNGYSENARSNALTVSWSGDIEAAGDITDGSGNTLSDKVDSSTLNSLFVSKSYSASASISGNTAASVTGSDLSVSTPSGYTPVGVVKWATGHNAVMCRGIDPTATGSSAFAYLRNVTNSSVTYTFAVTVLYIKSSFYTAQ